MGNRNISLTSEKYNITKTVALEDRPVVNKVNKSIAVLVVMMSAYALTGSPATSVNIPSSGFGNAVNMVSVTDTKNIEKQFKKKEYSFITSKGFEDDNVKFPDMFI